MQWRDQFKRYPYSIGPSKKSQTISLKYIQSFLHSRQLQYLNFVGGDVVFLIFNFHFVVVYLICFHVWLRVLRSWKVVIYSDGDNIIIIIIIIIVVVVVVVGFLVYGLSWFYVGCVGISLVVIPSLNVDEKSRW